MSEALYMLEQVTKAYGTRSVLAIDHLQIRQGEILALVGPSGAGKSTLLRLLNFLEMPTTGSLTFQGLTFNTAHAAPLALRRQVTMVFQRPVLLRRSVAANVAYGLGLRNKFWARTNRAAVGHAVNTALKEVGLCDMASQPARTLSGGEAQRVALARALVLHPEALLLDEPTANLDPYNVSLIEQIITRRNQEHGTTMVLVTHNIFQAKRLAQRVALLLDGRIVEVADTAQFFEAPQDARTAAFVRGEMVY
ncbi:MAG: phosphate ABC transporter ATP-binding protein [Caldilineaceae bacterium]